MGELFRKSNAKWYLVLAMSGRNNQCSSLHQGGATTAIITAKPGIAVSLESIRVAMERLRRVQKLSLYH